VSLHCPASLLIDGGLRVPLWLSVCVCHLDVKYSRERSVGLFDGHCIAGPYLDPSLIPNDLFYRSGHIPGCT